MTCIEDNDLTLVILMLSTMGRTLPVSSLQDSCVQHNSACTPQSIGNADWMLMRPYIAYTHNEPCATLVRHLCDTFATIWDNLCSRTTKDDNRQCFLHPFAMSYTILKYSTVLPFTFATFSNLF